MASASRTAGETVAGVFFRDSGTNHRLFCFQGRMGVISALLVYGSEHLVGRSKALSRTASEQEKRAWLESREGWSDLTFAREKDGERRPRAENGADYEMNEARAPRRKKRSDSPELGNALRSAYQQTVAERIPDDLLDLLGKLS